VASLVYSLLTKLEAVFTVAFSWLPLRVDSLSCAPPRAGFFYWSLELSTSGYTNGASCGLTTKP
jgi:hypothetical protein